MDHLKLHSANICLFLGVFSLFTLNVIVEDIGFTSAILLLVLCVSTVYFALVSPLLLSFVLSSYFLVYCLIHFVVSFIIYFELFS